MYASLAPAPELVELEQAIFFVKDHFQRSLAHALRLVRVTCPLFVDRNSGLQDNLSGVETPVRFRASQLGDRHLEVVQSLAKWKRYALFRYGVPAGRGIYCDMNALRPDEGDLASAIHSVHVDQWDWELAIRREDRTLATLRHTVARIYVAMHRTERAVCQRFGMTPMLPRRITFVHSEDLCRQHPHLTPRQREDLACRRHGAVFLVGIGGQLPDGGVHDGRAPDYDDWSTPTGDGRQGLNGDILVWSPVLQRALELSSMGVRVDAEALVRQCTARGCRDRLQLPWHRLLLDGRLPDSIGGGIGQSRLCMFLLRRRHIGEVQASLWPDHVLDRCRREHIRLL